MAFLFQDDFEGTGSLSRSERSGVSGSPSTSMRHRALQNPCHDHPLVLSQTTDWNQFEESKMSCILEYHNDVMARIRIPKRLQLIVFVRDHWTCQYCGSEVLFSPALKALDELHPNHAYYHRNGASSRMAKVLLDKCGCVDHITPVALGGTNDIDNLVCSCWSCNLKKSSLPPEQYPRLEPAAKSSALNWDGMFSIHEKMYPEDEWCKLMQALR